MSDNKKYIQILFKSKGVEFGINRSTLFEQFVENEENIAVVKKILENQNLLMNKWKLFDRITTIKEQQIVIPNASIGKPYSAKLDFTQLNLNDLVLEKFEGLEEIGLTFNKITDTIEGVPTQSGDLKIKFYFKISGENSDSQLNEKEISLVVNPDPKTLWKDLPSDKNNIFWKEDDVSVVSKLGERNIVVSSKRGRSHKNVGSFRDDDFAFKHYEKSGWSVVAVSDGAGSYSLSRKGSQIACNSVVEFFEQHSDLDKAKEFEEKLSQYITSKDENLYKEIEILAKQNLYKATTFVYNAINEHSFETFKSNPELFNNPKAKTYIDYYHSTLIFALFKKYDFGYVILTFGVGDCPIGIINKEETEITLLNWLDVGEHGGGTRFITEYDIFVNEDRPIASRFNLKIVKDFSYLFLMSDGIYDAKFIVEANLEKIEKWQEFLKDLKGDNEVKVAVDFNPENKDISTQLSNWMDFWSQGNHDDRTLAIIY